jgi:hypothetical protein
MHGGPCTTRQALLLLFPSALVVAVGDGLASAVMVGTQAPAERIQLVSVSANITTFNITWNPTQQGASGSPTSPGAEDTQAMPPWVSLTVVSGVLGYPGDMADIFFNFTRAPTTVPANGALMEEFNVFNSADSSTQVLRVTMQVGGPWCELQCDQTNQ